MYIVIRFANTSFVAFEVPIKCTRIRFYLFSDAHSNNSYTVISPECGSERKCQRSALQLFYYTRRTFTMYEIDSLGFLYFLTTRVGYQWKCVHFPLFVIYAHTHTYALYCLLHCSIPTLTGHLRIQSLFLYILVVAWSDSSIMKGRL